MILIDAESTKVFPGAFRVVRLVDIKIGESSFVLRIRGRTKSLFLYFVFFFNFIIADNLTHERTI